MSSFDILPIALTCGEPAGIGPEIAARAWEEIGSRLPFFLIGDPSHLPKGTPLREITHPREAERAAMHGLPVLPHPFEGPAIPGSPDPRNARSVIDVISRAVQLVSGGGGRGCLHCTDQQEGSAGRGRFRISRPYGVSRASRRGEPCGDDARLP